MDVLRAIRQRRSVRKFKDRPIPRAARDALVEALRWAPSAGNLQSRRFFFVEDEERKRNLARFAHGQNYIAEAPLAVVACADRNRIRGEYGARGTSLYCLLDVAASVQNLLLAAEAKGLATCWIAAFSEAKVRRLLDLPAHLRPVTIVPVGYADETPQPPPRLPPEEIVG